MSLLPVPKTRDASRSFTQPYKIGLWLETKNKKEKEIKKQFIFVFCFLDSGYPDKSGFRNDKGGNVTLI